MTTLTLTSGWARALYDRPVVISGAKYLNGSQDVLHAIDVASGEGLWQCDAEVTKTPACAI